MYFSEMFMEADSDEIIYNGEKISRCYNYDIKGKRKLKFQFISKPTQIEQLIVLAFEPGNKIKVKYNDQLIKPRGKRFPTIDIFRDSIGDEFVLDIEVISGKMCICNGHIEDFGDKKIVSYLDNGHAMKITKKGNVLNFKCNSDEDGHDFDDLEFEIEFIEVE